MITQMLTPFDTTKKAIEGSNNFRANASYSWSWLIEHTSQQNILITQLNAEFKLIADSVEEIKQTAEQINDNILFASTKAEEANNSAYSAQQSKEAALDYKNSAQQSVEAALDYKNSAQQSAEVALDYKNSINPELFIKIDSIVNSLDSSATNKVLSANQGKILKDLIDNINTLLSSDDSTLDQMQEVVNFIKQNKDDLQNLDLSNIAETITLKHFTALLKAKLDGIAENANNYTHPLSHDANMITESSEKRFVSDTEKATWNSKQLELTSGENIKTINNVSILGSGNIEVSGCPTGAIIAFAALTAQPGFLKSNGSLISRTNFPDLWAFAQSSGALVSDTEWFNSKRGCFSTGDGSTTFRIPDLRAEFIRGWDDGRGVDTARVFGSAQADELKSHRHTDPYQLNGGVYNYLGTYTHGNGTQSYSGYEGGTETRPKNIALLYCIKY